VDLANHQAALGHEVHVAGMRHSPLAGALAPNVRFHGFSRLFRGLLLRRLVGRLAPDVCHGHLSAACKALGQSRGLHHTIATLHVGYKPHQHARLGGLICVNRAQAGRLHGYNGRVSTIPNWLPQPPAAASAHGLRAELGLAPGTLVIGSVGRLHESKGADVLVSSFLATAPANAALVLVGEGPQRAELEKLRAGDPRIHFVGYRSAVQDCLRDFDLFVSPSREESFGLAIVEAMSAGLPLIATAAEGPAEFLRDQPVTLVAPGSVEAMTAALADAVAEFEAGRLGRRTYDLSPFDRSARIASVMDFYGQVLVDAPQGSGVAAWAPVAATT
jgi:glycosyltransferase involved in cell wall biosynthesis